MRVPKGWLHSSSRAGDRHAERDSHRREPENRMGGCITIQMFWKKRIQAASVRRRRRRSSGKHLPQTAEWGPDDDQENEKGSTVMNTAITGDSIPLFFV